MSKISEEKLNQLQNVISKMPLELFCSIALSELGLDWKEVVKYAERTRLPLNPKSVAQIIRQYAAESISEEDIDDILSMLQLKLKITTTPLWHTIRMEEKIFGEEQMGNTVKLLPTRVLHATRSILRTSHTDTQVHSTNLGDFVYIRVQVVMSKKMRVLYLALPATNEPIVFVNSIANKKLIQAAVEGIGYKSYEDIELYGPDILSLYRIVDRRLNSHINQLTNPPVYNPTPVVTKHELDYTNTAYAIDYMDNLLGPNPPLLTNLQVTTVTPFVHQDILAKNIKITIKLKSDNIAETLKSWVVNKVMSPDSPLLDVFRLVKSNKVVYDCTEDHHHH